MKEVLSGQMQQPFFPVTAEMVFRAQLEYHPFSAGDRAKLGEATVSSIEVNHPGGNLAYRVDYRGRSFVYATDTEHGTERDAQLVEFTRDADVLVYDAMYTEDEYLGEERQPEDRLGALDLGGRGEGRPRGEREDARAVPPRAHAHRRSDGRDRAGR